MNLNQVEFVRSVAAVSDCPKDGLPQIAFAGKSNVGKSSVINRLLQRKNFARVGEAPGKTTQINFFRVDNRLYLVDLPGYGYAKVGRETSAKWGQMVEKYLHKSRQLKAVFLLVDMRHEPNANDKQMYEWIKANGFEPIIIMTKLDKLGKNERVKMVKAIREGLGAGKDATLLPYSAITKEGREEIYQVLDSYL